MNALKHIPPLPHSCNSWIIIDRETNKPVCELYNRSTVELVNFEKFRAVTALFHLVSINGSKDS